jgi:6-phosphogluconate dehydrogenase
VGVSIPVLEQPVMQLFASREKIIFGKTIAMMRNGLGGHTFGEDQGMKHKRESGRIGFYLKKSVERFER